MNCFTLWRNQEVGYDYQDMGLGLADLLLPPLTNQKVEAYYEHYQWEAEKPSHHFYYTVEKRSMGDLVLEGFQWITSDAIILSSSSCAVSVTVTSSSSNFSFSTTISSSTAVLPYLYLLSLQHIASNQLYITTAPLSLSSLSLFSLSLSFTYKLQQQQLVSFFLSFSLFLPQKPHHQRTITTYD